MNSPLFKYCWSFLSNLFFTNSGVCMDKISNCHDYGLDVCTKYRQWADKNCPRYCAFCQGWCSVFFSLETDLVYGVTPPSTICVSCMPNNDDSAKVHFCLAKHIWEASSQDKVSVPHLSWQREQSGPKTEDECERVQNH